MSSNSYLPTTPFDIQAADIPASSPLVLPHVSLILPGSVHPIISLTMGQYSPGCESQSCPSSKLAAPRANAHIGTSPWGACPQPSSTASFATFQPSPTTLVTAPMSGYYDVRSPLNGLRETELIVIAPLPLPPTDPFTAGPFDYDSLPEILQQVPTTDWLRRRPMNGELGMPQVASCLSIVSVLHLHANQVPSTCRSQPKHEHWESLAASRPRVEPDVTVSEGSRSLEGAVRALYAGIRTKVSHIPRSLPPDAPGLSSPVLGPFGLDSVVR